MSGGLLEAGAVALGGGVGAALRYAVDRVITHAAQRGGSNYRMFPWGISVVNLSGSFALGLLVGMGIAWPALTGGLLGGYTTLSTASLDTVRLLRERRRAAAVANAFGTLIAAIVLVVAGISLGAAIR